MKKLLFILIMLPFWVNGQDCKKIEKERDDLKNFTRISMPDVKTLAGFVRFSKYKSDSNILNPNEREDIILTLVSHTTVGMPNYNMKGVLIRFADGSIYKSETTKISCKYISGGAYQLLATISIPEDVLKEFIDKKISKYTFEYRDFEIKKKQAEKIQASANCIKNAVF